MTAKIKKPVKTSHYHKPKGVSDRAYKKIYWPYIPLILIIGLLISFSSRSGAFTGLRTGSQDKVLSYATKMSLPTLLADTNSDRSQNSIGQLKINAKLNAAAQAKANDMAARNYWSHNTPEGNPPWSFVTSQGYDYQKLGENLAAGFNDASATVNGWMASPPHRENLLDPAFSEVGFGFANNPNYSAAGGGPMTIVVAYYGEPSGPPSSPPLVAAPTSATPTPANTSNEPSAQLAARTSRMQVALGDWSFAKIGTSLAIFLAAAAAGAWASKHALAFRRAFVHGEKFVIRHPVLDLCFLAVIALSILLSQTAGLIQ